jgi:hypothetical protein
VLEYCERTIRKCDDALAAAGKKALPCTATIDLEWVHLARLHATQIAQAIEQGKPIPPHWFDWLAERPESRTAACA